MRQKDPVSAKQAGIQTEYPLKIIPKRYNIPNTSHLYFVVQKVENDLMIKIGPYNARLKRKQVLTLAKVIRDYLVGNLEEEEEVRE